MSSLCHKDMFSIPVLLLVGWRGEPGRKDETHHLINGKLLPLLLQSMKLPYAILPDYEEGLDECLDKAYTHLSEKKEPYVLLVKKRTFDIYDY